MATELNFIDALKSNMEFYKYQPAAIQRTILDMLDQPIVDPTNPFIFLLETSVVNTSLFLLENFNNMKKMYPQLATDKEDLFHHMADIDYLKRFANAASANFTMMVLVSDFNTKAVTVNPDGYKQITITRNTEVEINETVFSFQYPIVIKQFNNNIFQVSYDNDVLNPVMDLNTLIINHNIFKDTSGNEWLTFTIPLLQFKIETSYYPVHSSIVFKETIDFTDQFYYARVYNQKNNDTWTEIKTTHSDQVFDPYAPTALLHVNDNTVSVYIPPNYILSGQLDGNIRIDIYVTKGAINKDLGKFDITAFKLNFKAIDEGLDNTPFTDAGSNVSMIIFSKDVVTEGSDGISFEDLRARVINNSVGPIDLPITNIQLIDKVIDNNYTVLANIDVVTNRQFLLTRQLPTPSFSQLITPANLTIDTIVLTNEVIEVHPGIINNGLRKTILSNQIFINDNGVVSLYPPVQLDALLNYDVIGLANTVNGLDLLYNPYYYVVDITGDEFDINAYDLDSPEVNQISFIDNNPTVQLNVNTDSINIEKISEGYRIVLLTKSDDFYKKLLDNEIAIYLAYRLSESGQWFYNQGTLIGKTDGNERYYEFTIKTNHDVNSNHELYIGNFKISMTDDFYINVPLTVDLYIFHAISSINTEYQPSLIDDDIPKQLSNTKYIGVSKEVINVKFGNHLKHLYTNTRLLPTGLNYKIYYSDVPRVYTEDVYQVDPDTGAGFTFDLAGNIIYNRIHKKGDPVIDSNGDPVYLARKGDVVLDPFGEPITDGELTTSAELSILLVDAKYYFVTKDYYVAYIKELRDTLTNWLINDIDSISDRLLEQSALYFSPKQTHGRISVLVDNDVTVNIPCQQTLTVSIWLTDVTRRDPDAIKLIQSTCIKVIDAVFSETIISTQEMERRIKLQLQYLIKEVEITGLGGNNNYIVVKPILDNTRLTIDKKLVVFEDNTLHINEGVIMNYISYNG